MGASNQHFCSVENLQQGEPLAGMGGEPVPHLLLVWPRKKWIDHVFTAKDMPEAVLTRLKAIREQGWRVQLIDRRGEDYSTRRVFTPMSGHEYTASDAELPHLLEALITGESNAAHWRSGPSPDRLILCCTHGKVDRCCAKFGNAAYKAIRSENESQNYGFDVWECSHVGGCRLAANVMALPAKRMYGRVTPEAVPELLAAEAAGQPYMPCFRGVAELSSLGQCADLAARYWLDEHGMAADSVTVTAPDDPAEPCAVNVAVQWRSGHQSGSLQVHCWSREMQVYGSCDDLAAGEANKVLRWWAESVTSLASGEASGCV